MVIYCGGDVTFGVYDRESLRRWIVLPVWIISVWKPTATIFIPTADVDEMSGLTTLAPPTGISPYQPRQSVKGLNPQTHPIITAVTMPCLHKTGRLQLGKAMKLAGCTWEQMPIIPTYVSPQNENSLCYNWALGRCGAKTCQRAHAPKEEIMDKFAYRIVQLTHQGFESLMSTCDIGGGTKRKAGGR